MTSIVIPARYYSVISAKLSIPVPNARRDLILLMENASRQLKKLNRNFNKNGIISRRTLKEIIKMRINKKKEEKFS